MENLAPKVFRQRLLIDFIYTTEMHEKLIIRFLKELTKELGLKIYSPPVVHVSTGRGKKINSGFDAFAPLVASGIYFGTWSQESFVSMVMYTCKGFNAKKAVEFTRKFFKASKLAYKQF